MRDRAADRRLMRYLHGELPAKDVRELRAELAKSPALQARLAELHRLWQGLQPSPPTPAPFGYLPKIQRLAEQQRATTVTRIVGSGMAPWVGALAAAALVTGVLLGVGLGRMPQKAQAVVAEESGAAAAAASPPVSASESVGASAASSTAAGREAAASPSASPPVPYTTTPPRTPEAAAPTQGGSSSTSSATDLADAIAGDDTAALASGGSNTLAEEYWQALEGLDGSGNGGGGGEGDAGW